MCQCIAIPNSRSCLDWRSRYKAPGGLGVCVIWWLQQMGRFGHQPHRIDLFVKGFQYLIYGTGEYGLEYIPDVILCCTDEDD